MYKRKERQTFIALPRSLWGSILGRVGGAGRLDGSEKGGLEGRSGGSGSGEEGKHGAGWGGVGDE